MSKVKFVSWNVRGLGNQNKKLKVLNHLLKLKADICLLQETHATDQTYQKIKTSHYNHIFSAHYNSKQRGVCILISQKIQFTHNATTSDPEGRYIIINISINNTPITIGNVYGPNSDDPTFFQNFFSLLSDFSHCPIIIAGDFNTVLNPTIDRSSNHNARTWNSTDTLNHLIEDFGLGDSWRLKHPTKQQYTFHSPVHHSYSRIDLILTSNSIMSQITDQHIHPILISDHAPISITWNIINQPKITSRWRFNTSLLSDPVFDSFFNREWTSFMELNDSPTTSPSLLWQTGKAVLTGRIIAFSVNKAKKEKELEQNLVQSINTLEQSNMSNPSQEQENEIRKLKQKLNEILDKKTNFLINRLRQEHFMHCNKSGKFLANQIKLNKEKSSIPTILNSAGKPTTSHKEINDIFHNFYKDLFSSETQPNLDQIHFFLNNIHLPKVSPNQIPKLESPITEIELHSALKQMPNNKSPGPDGFPAEFYKHFWTILSPLFCRMLQESNQNSKLPLHMNSATISLILKPNKDPTLPSSYRPISLINVDTKIIAKTLALRLNTVIPTIIHPDQTGFIKNRHSTTNTRRLLNLIHWSTQQSQKTIITSLDAEKAFDRVDWTFLFATLGRFGFGESFINWIRVLYTSPTATVVTNGLTSRPFTLHRGNRQGCPLSPLLFLIYIEPLAAAIRQNTNIKGIQTQNIEHKISLYADDILLFLQNPYPSLLETIKLIDSFSKISQYSINWNKSSILPLHPNSWDVAASSIPNTSLPLSSNHITYLGTKISPRLSELFTLNFPPLLKKIETDLQCWNNVPISIIGRISLIKMSVLPKIIYLIQMTHLSPSASWFQSLDSIINKFYWKNTTPRIKLTTLQKPKSQGGLNAPNFHHYSLAIHLQYILKWTHPDTSDSIWTDIEQTICNNIQISDLPFLPPKIKKNPLFKTPTIAATLTAWWKLHQINNTPLSPSKYTPIWHNPELTLNNKPVNFQSWAKKGITHLHHIITNNTIIPLTDLTQEYGIGSKCFLEYSQLKSILKNKIINHSTTLDLPNLISEFLSKSPPKITSKIYKVITKIDTSISLPVTKWQQDLAFAPNADFWPQICKNIYLMTKNSNLQLIQFKILHRYHYTGYRLSKMGFGTDTCSHCSQGNRDDYLHALWNCTPVHNFWETVTNSLSSLLHCHIPLSPSLCILGDTTSLNLQQCYIKHLLVSLAIAKKVILVNWKYRKKIHITIWENFMSEYFSLETSHSSHSCPFISLIQQ